MRFVIVPGINGSGPGHWQSVWQDAWGSSASRIGPSSWDEPDLADWCQALDRAAQRHQPGEVVLVAHSLGCLAVTASVAALRLFWIGRRRVAETGAIRETTANSSRIR